FSLYYQFFEKKKDENNAEPESEKNKDKNKTKTRLLSFSTVNMLYLYLILVGTWGIVSLIVKLIASSFGFEFVTWSWLWAVLLGGLAFFLLLSMAFQSFRQDSYIPETLAEKVVAIFMVFGLFIFYIAVFARGAYNEIPSGFGGGRPDQVSFILDATSKPYL